MKPHSRVIIRAGINFITIPASMINTSTLLAFQQAVVSNGLEYNKLETQKNGVILFRDSPSPLQITVNMLEPPMGQLLVVALQSKGSLAFELFTQEVEAVIQSYEAVWPAPNRQVIKADADIQELYETTSPHAFQELWEKRLGQPSQSLAAFGRPIRGGGLRFVMEPIQEEMPVQIEVKIESFLRDTTKVFVETQFVWPVPTKPGTPFDARQRLTYMNEYIKNQINAFLSGESK
jgi:hypothetical protein